VLGIGVWGVEVLGTGSHLDRIFLRQRLLAGRCAAAGFWGHVSCHRESEFE
jgi:hypothetical protein